MPFLNSRTVVTIKDQVNSGNATSAPKAAYAVTTPGPQPLFVVRTLSRSAWEDAVCLTKMSDGSVIYITQSQLINPGGTVTI